MTDKKELTDAVETRKAEGSLGAYPVAMIGNNPHRPDEVFVWNEEKLLGLKETYLVDGFQSTFEITSDKWDNVFLAGGGHHRMESLRRVIAEGLGGSVRGLFKNDKGEWCVKVVKKKYTPDQMLRNFMIENADAWNKDSQQNICMMVLQVKDYLDRLMADSADVDEFVEAVKSPYPLKMDERAYTRAKNSGIGASTLVQYLGENTWSRQAIDFAIKVLYEEGPEGEKLKELAEKLPNITMAYKFKRLMVQEVDGEKVLSSADDQAKAEKVITKESLSRTDLEKADKIKQEKGLSPLDALNEVVAEKKGDKVAAKEANKTVKPEEKKVKPSEEALEALKRAFNAAKILVASDDSFSKAQLTQAKDVFKDLAALLKKMDTATNGKKTKK